MFLSRSEDKLFLRQSEIVPIQILGSRHSVDMDIFQSWLGHSMNTIAGCPLFHGECGSLDFFGVVLWTICVSSDTCLLKDVELLLRGDTRLRRPLLTGAFGFICIRLIRPFKLSKSQLGQTSVSKFADSSKLRISTSSDKACLNTGKVRLNKPQIANFGHEFHSFRHMLFIFNALLSLLRSSFSNSESVFSS